MEEELEVIDFINNRHWDEDKLVEVISEEMIHHTIENIKPILSESNIEKAWWTGNSNRNFTIKSNFNMMRRGRVEPE